MSRIQVTLAAVLAGQVALGAFMWWPREPTGGEVSPLIDAEEEDVSEVEIISSPAGDKEPTSVRFAREGSGWRIASSADFPAEGNKVDDVVEKLLALQIRQPIATQSMNHKALGVADDEYGKRVKVTAKGETKDFFIGAASGSSVHIRFADSPDVYLSRGMSEWDLQARPQTFWNTDYVSLEEDALLSLTVQNAQGSFTLIHEEGWLPAEPLPEGRQLDAGKVQGLVTKIAKIRMVDVVGKEVKPEYGLQQGTKVTWTIEEENQTSSSFFVVGSEVESDFYVKSEASPYVIRAAAYSVRSLTETTRDSLLADLPEEEAEGAQP